MSESRLSGYNRVFDILPIDLRHFTSLTRSQHRKEAHRSHETILQYASHHLFTVQLAPSNTAEPPARLAPLLPGRVRTEQDRTLYIVLDHIHYTGLANVNRKQPIPPALI